LGEDGRPIVVRGANGQLQHGWHHYDPQRPIESAYYACPHCYEAISWERRVKESYFTCKKSGVKLRSFLNGLPYGAPDLPISAGITLSPLIRDSIGHGAVEIIRKGVEGDDSNDWQQQELGIASTATNGGITIAMIKAALEPRSYGLPIFADYWGLDQGTTEHWIARVRYYIPPDRPGEPRLTPMQKYRGAKREVLLLRDVPADAIGDLVEACTGGCVDVDPGRSDAVEWQKKYRSVALADQRGRREMAKDVVRHDSVQVGRKKVAVSLIDHHQLQSNILDAFAAGLVQLPLSVDPNDLGPMSATRHLTTSARDPETGSWTRPSDSKDDLLKAIVFAEARFYMQVFGLMPSGTAHITDILPTKG
jgi:hypothetical protein